MMERLIYSLKNNSLKLKIILYSVLLTILPVIIMGIISYRKSYLTMLDTTIRNTRQLSSQMAKNAELSFYEIEKFLSIRRNPNTIRFLLSQTKEERNQYAFQLLDMIGLYKNNYRFSQSVKDIQIIGTELYDFSERYGVTSYEPYFRQAYIDQFGKTDGAMVVSLQSDSQEARELDLFIGGPVLQVATNDVIGVVVVTMDAEPFTDFTRDTKLGQHGTYFFRDQSGIFFDENGILPEDLFSESEKDMISASDDGYFERETPDGKELIFYGTINNYQWKVIGRVQVNDLMSGVLGIRRYFYIVMLLCIAASGILNIWVVRWLFIPLDKLKRKMSIAAEGNLDVTLTHHSSDEIAQLNDTFNNMMAQIKDLMQKVRNEKDELQKSQLRVLQAQINPHFLYNTLDTIIWLIFGHENEKAIEMVDSLSKFFRTSLSNGRDFISVREEIEHVRNYLAIQKNREGDLLSYQIDINEDILDVRVMKLILQPVVENAVYHGLKPKGGGTVWIKGWADEGDIIYTVRDNGVGMDQAKLDEIEKAIGESGTVPDEHGFGLFNVQRRIKLYYGEGYGLTINSWENEGTIITIQIKGEVDA